MLDANKIADELGKLFPDAKCELNYRNVFELSIAVILSAQTTDKSVNNVTPKLFSKYPTLNDLSEANQMDVMKIIEPIGLAKTKSSNIINFSKEVINNFNGIIPDNIDDLVTLPGVGRKTANVIISEGYHKPGFAVDVHVSRVTKRLGIVEDSDTPEKIEYKLKAMFDEELWHTMHHRFIFMGRYLCTSKKPNCDVCPFKKECKYE